MAGSALGGALTRSTVSRDRNTGSGRLWVLSLATFAQMVAITGATSSIAGGPRSNEVTVTRSICWCGSAVPTGSRA